LDATLTAGKVFNEGISQYFDKTDIEKIRKVKIGIAGAGGLGSNCALFLVRSGFVNFVIADFDVVAVSNLNRQFFFESQIGMRKIDALCENLNLINSSVNIQRHCVRVDRDNALQIFGCCDAVVEAFDNPESKALLVEKAAGAKIFTVCASGIGGIGSSDEVITRRVNDFLVMVGDSKRQIGNGINPYAPRVAVAAAKQADVILEYFLSRKFNEKKSSS
jgi:sulfur carrier protein ThiS adenylyltransferase